MLSSPNAELKVSFRTSALDAHCCFHRRHGVNIRIQTCLVRCQIVERDLIRTLVEFVNVLLQSRIGAHRRDEALIVSLGLGCVLRYVLGFVLGSFSVIVGVGSAVCGVISIVSANSSTSNATSPSSSFIRTFCCSAVARAVDFAPNASQFVGGILKLDLVHLFSRLVRTLVVLLLLSE